MRGREKKNERELRRFFATIAECNEETNSTKKAHYVVETAGKTTLFNGHKVVHA
jgi:hypothetical protein